MNWTPLTSVSQLEEIKKQSHEKNVVIFKHSTRCSISGMALNRFERSWSANDSESIEPYLLDLIEHRDVSNEIQNVFKVIHESPQIILIKDGESIYDASHMNINYQGMTSALN